MEEPVTWPPDPCRSLLPSVREVPAVGCLHIPPISRLYGTNLGCLSPSITRLIPPHVGLSFGLRSATLLLSYGVSQPRRKARGRRMESRQDEPEERRRL